MAVRSTASITRPKTVAYMTADHTRRDRAGAVLFGPVPVTASVSALRCARRQALRSRRARSATKLGRRRRTYFWVDPKEDMFVIYGMQAPSQRVHYRQVLRDMVYSAIDKPSARAATD